MDEVLPFISKSLFNHEAEVKLQKHSTPCLRKCFGRYAQNMHFQNQLESLIETLFGEIKDGRGQHISILIPGHKGQFLIMDTFQLILRKSDTTSLSILFSHQSQTRLGKKMFAQIGSSHCLDGFAKLHSKSHNAFVKEIGNDKVLVADKVVKIIEVLFPSVELNAIQLKLKTIDARMTIEESL